MFQVVRRTRTGRAGLRRFLADLAESSAVTRTDILPRGFTLESVRAGSVPQDLELELVVREVGGSATGLAVFWTGEGVEVVVPPLPLKAGSRSTGFHAAPLLDLLDTEYGFGIVLLRLGRYAVGVLRGDRLIASKSDTRYVKSRHRKGGSSAGRFARSRERLVRELYDKCCEVTRAVFGPHEGSIDYVLMGGERHTLNGLRKRCPYIRGLGDRLLDRVLAVDKPGRRALEEISGEVWTSRIVTLVRDREEQLQQT